MKKLINYLFPNDWYDVETIDVTHHSSLTGTPEILGKRIIVQKPKSTRLEKTAKRIKYMHEVAEAFEITVNKPFSGEFYFETYPVNCGLERAIWEIENPS